MALGIARHWPTAGQARCSRARGCSEQRQDQRRRRSAGRSQRTPREPASWGLASRGGAAGAAAIDREAPLFSTAVEAAWPGQTLSKRLNLEIHKVNLSWCWLFLSVLCGCSRRLGAASVRQASVGLRRARGVEQGPMNRN